MPNRFPRLALTVAALGTASIASAQGLEMSFSQTDLGGGLTEYSFSVTPDAGWAPGMGWRWFIFGDEPGVGGGGTGVSPIADFTMDPAQFPIGPWTSLSSSGGGHNGPTFASVLDYWIPATGTETLRWVGQSTGCVGPNEMLFSTLAGTVGGATAANWDVATLIGPGTCGVICPTSAINFDTSTGNNVCDIFDFLAFQNLFVAGDPCACDFDTSTGPGVCDIFDFLGFQTSFVAGCP